MPASPSPPSVPPSNHLGGDDRLVFSPPVVRTPVKKRKPEDDIDDIPEFPEEEDARDPDAQPPGPSLPPIADDDDEQPASPESPEAVIVDSDIPDDVAVEPDELVRSIETGTLRQVDVHPPFRTLVKHKAFITEWVINNLLDPQFALTFFAEDISDCVYSLMYAS